MPIVKKQMDIQYISKNMELHREGDNRLYLIKRDADLDPGIMSLTEDELDIIGALISSYKADKENNG